MKKFIYGAAVIAGAAIAGSALAQSSNDYNWSGPYVGVNLGYGGGDFKYGASGTSDPAGTTAASGRFRQSSSGVLGGGQLGYNFEMPNGVLLGVETDIAASDIGAKTSFSSTDSLGDSHAGDVRSKIDYLGTVRGRLGKAMFDGRFVPYVTGGFAYGGVKSSADYNCSGCTETGYSAPSTTQTGWTAGAGAEYALTHHLSMKAEYLYTDLGRENVGSDVGQFSAGGATLYNADVSEKATANVVRVGLNYRF